MGKVIAKSNVAGLWAELANSLLREVPGKPVVRGFEGVVAIAVERDSAVYDAVYLVGNEIHVVIRWGGSLGEYDEWRISEEGVKYTGTMDERPIPAWAHWVLREAELI